MLRCPFCQHENAPAADRCTACGAALTTIAESRDDDNPESASAASNHPPFDERIRQLLIDGQKIEAVKVYREETGAGLREAKEAVEAIERREVLFARVRDGTNPADLPRELEQLLRSDNLIGAIKLYRERTGRGLKESKDTLEAFARERGIPLKKAGCGGTVFFLLATALGACALIALL
jgi:ribosomal protein L7/L12